MLEFATTSTYYIVIVLVMLAMFTVFLIFKKHNLDRRKQAPVESTINPQSESESIPAKQVLNALVFDNITHSYGERHIDLIPGNDYGKPIRYFNNLVFMVFRLADGSIVPVGSAPYANLEHSPAETYRAARSGQRLIKLFMPRNKKDNWKMGLIILGVCAALFIAFMAASSLR